MADFDPRQLDQLEDLLEGLDELDDLDELELAPALTERLAAYQDVLAMCRDAFPVEEPRADLLADVIAEANAVSRRPKLREADGSGWQRFWQRWRGSLIPGLALAGTTAAVLLLLEPNRELDRSAELASQDHASDDSKREPDTTPSEPASEPQVDDGDGGEDAEGAKDGGDADADSNGVSVEPDPKAGAGLQPPAASPSQPGGLDKRSSKKAGSGGTPALEPEPSPEPLSKDETWTVLDRANADRRRGDCDRARARYEEIIAASSDSLAVARAQAGMGLCFEQDRRSSEANQWFSKARSGNAGIDAWIEDQRDEQPLPGESKKSKAKSKQAMPANADALESL